MSSDSALPGNFCSQCGKSPAGNHVCFGGTGESVVMCDDCLARQSSSIADFFKVAKNAECDFCGGSPCTGGPEFLTPSAEGNVANRWLCGSCAPEYYTFLQTKMADLVEVSNYEKQLEEMKRIAGEAEVHMKQFVRRRDN
ncbi:hypothetical protein AAFN60_01290 [Roseibacillus persicicus]|uniref:hypothetical protein n=1 Tax=Roseibacillus persicicus TaxID=454148 RepID=UPI00398A67A1